MAFGTLALSSAMASGLIWQSLQSRVAPYVVEVDRLGEPRAVFRAEVDYEPTDPQIAYQLACFIENVRGVSLDPVLMRRNWLQAYDFASERGAMFLGEYARARQPFARIGEQTASVQVTSVLRASNRSFQVKWTESEYERGSQAGLSRWTAILTIVTKVPRTADDLRRNPLGIYVDAIDWSREIEGDATQVRPTPSQTAAATAISDPSADRMEAQP